MADLVNYVKTDWVNDSVPAINEFNLNKIEKGIDDVTIEVIKLRDNPPISSETVLGLVKMWVVDNGDGTFTGNFSVV